MEGACGHTRGRARVLALLSVLACVLAVAAQHTTVGVDAQSGAQYAPQDAHLHAAAHVPWSGQAAAANASWESADRAGAAYAPDASARPDEATFAHAMRHGAPRAHSSAAPVRPMDVGAQFVRNQGQTTDEVEFVAAHAGGMSLFVLRDGLVLRSPAHTLRITYEGASPDVRVEGILDRGARTHYTLGGDRAADLHEVPTYGGVRWRNLYDGIDLVVSGVRASAGGGVKSEFVVAPGASAEAIRVHYARNGTHTVHPHVDARGVLHIADGLTETAPVLLQDGAEVRDASAAWRVDGGTGRVRVHVRGAVRSDVPLVIDPFLSYATLVGGAGNDQLEDVVLGDAGSVYVAGTTSSVAFPSLTALESGAAPAGGDDVFVLHVNDTMLLSATFYGGPGDEALTAIGRDPATGGLVATGETTSHHSHFPIIDPILVGNYTGGSRIFLAYFTPTLIAVGSTRFGGNETTSVDRALGMRIMPDGNVYLCGTTTSQFFPVSVNAFQPDHAGGRDAFAMKFGGVPRGLIYSTLFGDSGNEDAFDLEVDALGQMMMVGITTSPLLYSQPKAGLDDGFVVQWHTDATSLIWLRLVGTPGTDKLLACAYNGDTLLAVGFTSSDALATTPNAYQHESGGNSDVMIVELAPTTGDVQRLSYFGGTLDELALSVTYNAHGDPYIGGQTLSPNFPTHDALAQSEAVGGGTPQAFVAKLNATSVVYSTTWGGSGLDRVTGLVTDDLRNVYIVGMSDSTDFPAVEPQLSATHQGGRDGFLMLVNDGFCRGLVTQRETIATFGDGSGGADYFSSSECRFLVQPALARSVVLTMRALDFANGTVLRVYNGREEHESALIATVDNGRVRGVNDTDAMWTYEADYDMLLVFETGDTVSDGFTASYFTRFCKDMVTLDAPNLAFSDGSADLPYGDHTTCSWSVAPARTDIYRTVLFVDAVGLAPHDNITVYDGAMPGHAPVLRTFNLNDTRSAALPRDAASKFFVEGSSSELSVAFWAQSETTASGFDAHYYAQFCGGATVMIDARAGLLSDGSAGDPYGPRSQCAWHIKPTHTNFTSLVMFLDAFDLDADSSVRVYAGGAADNTTLVATFTGEKAVAGHVEAWEAESLSHEMFVVFESGNHAGAGFEGVFNTFSCARRSVITTQNATFTDGGMDGEYTRNNNCTWLVATGEPEFVAVMLYFGKFDVQLTDKVVVYDASHVSNTSVVAELTGLNIGGKKSDLYTVLVPSPRIMMQFVSSGGGDAVRSGGFEATVLSMACWGGHARSDFNGSVVDGSRAFDYSPYTHCEWTIKPEYDVLQIDFFLDLVDLGGNQTYLTFYDGRNDTAPLLATYDGQRLIPGANATNHTIIDAKGRDPSFTVSSTGAAMHVVFRAEEQGGGGFAGVYRSVFCREVQMVNTNPNATVFYFGDGSGPRSDYNPRTNCSWHIDIQLGNVKAIAVEMLTLDVGRDTELTVYDGLSIFNSPIRTWSAVKRQDDDARGNFVAKGGAAGLVVQLHGTGADTNAGFDAFAYALYCDELVTYAGSTGVVVDGSGDELPYGPHSDCSFLIAPADTTVDSVLLRFNSFDLAEGSSLAVYDGVDANAPLLRMYTPNAQPSEPLVSSARAMFLHFTAGLEQAGGFNATWEPKKFCEGTQVFTASEGVVSDGSGDEDYTLNADCTFIIRPRGDVDHIVLTVTFFETVWRQGVLTVLDGDNPFGTQLANVSGIRHAWQINSTSSAMYLHFESTNVRGKGWEATYDTVFVVLPPFVPLPPGVGSEDSSLPQWAIILISAFCGLVFLWSLHMLWRKWPTKPPPIAEIPVEKPYIPVPKKSTVDWDKIEATELRHIDNERAKHELNSFYAFYKERRLNMTNEIDVVKRRVVFWMTMAIRIEVCGAKVPPGVKWEEYADRLMEEEVPFMYWAQWITNEIESHVQTGDSKLWEKKPVKQVDLRAGDTLGIIEDSVEEMRVKEFYWMILAFKVQRKQAGFETEVDWEEMYERAVMEKVPEESWAKWVNAHLPSIPTDVGRHFEREFAGGTTTGGASFAVVNDADEAEWAREKDAGEKTDFSYSFRARRDRGGDAMGVAADEEMDPYARQAAEEQYYSNVSHAGEVFKEDWREGGYREDSAADWAAEQGGAANRETWDEYADRAYERDHDSYGLSYANEGGGGGGGGGYDAHAGGYGDGYGDAGGYGDGYGDAGGYHDDGYGQAGGYHNDGYGDAGAGGGGGYDEYSGGGGQSEYASYAHEYDEGGYQPYQG